MILLTEPAAKEVKRLLGMQGKDDWGLRVGVQGGGCSGLSYTLSFEEKPTDKDRVFDAPDGVKVFCDAKSYLYLNGMQLAYSNDLMGGGFKFENPNAQRTCSCGSSFSA